MKEFGGGCGNAWVARPVAKASLLAEEGSRFEVPYGDSDAADERARAG